MTARYFPEFETFQAKLARGNVVPVYRQLTADTHTPVSALRRVADGPYAFLLESVSGPENIGRYCFLGSQPFSTFKAWGERVQIAEQGGRQTTVRGDPLDQFESYLESFQLAPVEGLPRFSSGAVGYMGYDTVRFVEDLPDCPEDDRGLPDIFFMFFDEIIIFDHLNKTLKVVCCARPDEGSAREAYERACKRIDRTIEQLKSPIESPPQDIFPKGDGDIEYRSNFEREDYLELVEQAKEYIRAGDIFQVVPSQRLETQTSADPASVYRALRVINPSPYMFYLRMEDLSLVGASPEVMVRVESQQITVRPIAGTRRRGETEEEDRELQEELLSDTKERAEHTMLVDLARNDVGRVARFGTVQLDEVMAIEKYSHVMHIVSNVSGELEDGRTALDALKACLPAGTLSGAPKVRAMEIIDEFEPTKRGPYGGAVGYFDFSGNMDTCIAIRTIVMKGETAYVQAGGGIVADSNPEDEFEETLNKARALLRAIEIAEEMEE